MGTDYIWFWCIGLLFYLYCKELKPDGNYVTLYGCCHAYHDCISGYVEENECKNLIQLGCVFYIVAGLVLFLAKDNMALLATGNILRGMGTLPISMMGPLLIIECADYNEWCGRPRMEGTLGSINGFANKIGSAIGTFLCGVLMAASGYVGSAGDTAVLPDSALMMIRLLYGLIPAAFFAVVLFCLKFYTLDKKIDGMRKENEERRQNAEVMEEA